MKLKFELLPTFQNNAGTLGTQGKASNDGLLEVPQSHELMGTSGDNQQATQEKSPKSPNENQTWGLSKPFIDGVVPKVPAVPSKNNKESKVVSNPFCNEETFEQFGLGLLQSETGMNRLNHVYELAKGVSTSKTLAWQFAEALAIFEFIKDDRQACLECENYQHIRGTDHGRCLAAGFEPLANMAKNAHVNWHWINRCPKHTKRSQHV